MIVALTMSGAVGIGSADVNVPDRHRGLRGHAEVRGVAGTRSAAAVVGIEVDDRRAGDVDDCTVVVATLDSTDPSLTEISMVRGVVSGVPVLLKRMAWSASS